MVSLWGELPEVQKITTPAKILNEQASVLQEMSGGIIIGEVKKLLSAKDPNAIINEFRAVVPALNNYRVRIVRVSHGVLSYPCEILSLYGERISREVNDEAGFIEAVTTILRDKDLLNLLSSAMAQAIAVQE